MIDLNLNERARVVVYFEDRLEELRRMNDTKQTFEDTCHLRGRIEECRWILKELALPNRAETFTAAANKWG